MIYYLALVWDERNGEMSESAAALSERFLGSSPKWSRYVNQPGLIVFSHSLSGPNIYRSYVLDGGHGVVFGRLFETAYVERDDTDRVPPSDVRLDAQRSHAILANCQHELSHRYWGTYAAFVRDARSSKTWVLRDATGGIPCQWSRVGGISVYYVRLEDYERLNPSATYTINVRYVRDHILNFGCGRATGLNEVETVLPGECVEHHGGKRSSDFFWDPLKISETKVIEDLGIATSAIRRTTRACVHAWASCFSAIGHELSGGLDSSIVASCLADAPTRPKVVCQNLFSHDPGSDERAYARKVAQRTGFELIEECVRTNYALASVMEIRRAPFPSLWWMKDAEGDRITRNRIQAYGLEGQFSGEGGDEIFYTGGSLPTAVDYAWRHGVSRGLFTVAQEDAALDGVSVWKVLRAAREYGLRRRPWRLEKLLHTGYRPLIPPQVKEDAMRDPEFWHPLYRDNASVPPGKYAQAFNFSYGSLLVHHPSESTTAFARISPLWSQPLLELSLRIPVYLLRAGGRDRGLVRTAFASDVPREIILRKSKAFATLQFEQIFARNIEVVRELLLDGFLVREGLLDRTRLEEVLSTDLTTAPTGLIELCNYLSVEGWVRSLEVVRQEAAA